MGLPSACKGKIEKERDVGKKIHRGQSSDDYCPWKSIATTGSLAKKKEKERSGNVPFLWRKVLSSWAIAEQTCSSIGLYANFSCCLRQSWLWDEPLIRLCLQSCLICCEMWNREYFLTIHLAPETKDDTSGMTKSGMNVLLASETWPVQFCRTLSTLLCCIFTD